MLNRNGFRLAAIALLIAVSCEPMSPTDVQFQVNSLGVSAGESPTAFTDLSTGEALDERAAVQRLIADQGAASTSLEAQRALAVNEGLQVGSFFVHIRIGAPGEDDHPLRPCIPFSVAHIHITIKASSSTPDAQAYAKIHIAKWSQGNGQTCWAIFDSVSGLCWWTCGGDFNAALQFLLGGFREVLASMHLPATQQAIAGTAAALTSLLALIMEAAL